MCLVLILEICLTKIHAYEKTNTLICGFNL